MTTPHRARVVWSPDLLEYDFGTRHPMAPLRLDLTFRLARELGVLDRVDLIGADPAPDDILGYAHEPDYVAAVRHAAATGLPDVAHGLGTDDDPVFSGMHEAAARAVAGSVESALEVWHAKADHAVNLAGGLHHAMPDHASGFCIYNDPVAAIRAVLDAGARRVAYVDLDAHHGDGVEHAFWDDPRVLTVSVHESGDTLFPGSGRATDVGGAGALGTAANVALPAGTGDVGWLRAVDAVALPLLTAFRPEMIVSQHGCDAHRLDPLTHLRVSVDAQRAAAAQVHDAAHALSDGRWLALGGGGYAIAQVVPRAWTHLLAIAAHAPVDPQAPVPAPWREHVLRELGFPGPAVMGDGGEGRAVHGRLDPSDPVERAIGDTIRAVFGIHGLD